VIRAAFWTAAGSEAPRRFGTQEVAEMTYACRAPESAVAAGALPAQSKMAAKPAISAWR